MTPGTAGTIAKAHTDASLELRFTYVCNDDSDTSYGLLVGPRYAAGGDRIYLYFYPDRAVLAQRVSGVWTQLDWDGADSVEGTEYTARIVCDGSNVKVYRSEPGQLETKILETSSCTATATNYVAFTPQTDADFAIDNIRILSDDLRTRRRLPSTTPTNSRR